MSGGGRRFCVCVATPPWTLPVDRRRCARASSGRQYVQGGPPTGLQALAAALRDASFGQGRQAAPGRCGRVSMLGIGKTRALALGAAAISLAPLLAPAPADARPYRAYRDRP